MQISPHSLTPHSSLRFVRILLLHWALLDSTTFSWVLQISTAVYFSRPDWTFCLLCFILATSFEWRDPRRQSFSFRVFLSKVSVVRTRPSGSAGRSSNSRSRSRNNRSFRPPHDPPLPVIPARLIPNDPPLDRLRPAYHQVTKHLSVDKG